MSWLDRAALPPVSACLRTQHLHQCRSHQVCGRPQGHEDCSVRTSRLLNMPTGTAKLLKGHTASLQSSDARHRHRHLPGRRPAPQQAPHSPRPPTQHRYRSRRQTRSRRRPQLPRRLPRSRTRRRTRTAARRPAPRPAAAASVRPCAAACRAPRLLAPPAQRVRHPV